LRNEGLLKKLLKKNDKPVKKLDSIYSETEQLIAIVAKSIVTAKRITINRNI
jgi:hypothetical protein